MSNIKLLYNLMESFTPDENPAIFYAWEAVRLEPGSIPYREHLLSLLERAGFEEEYETVLREGIKECPQWHNGMKLFSVWLNNHAQYREALYNAQIAAENMPEDKEAQDNLLRLLARMKQGRDSCKPELRSALKAAKPPVRKRSPGRKLS